MIKLDVYDGLNIGFSIVGAGLFIIAIIFELKNVQMLRAIKKQNKWILLLVLTILFFFGYIVNILAILLENIPLQTIFNAIVFLFGAIFVVTIVYISFSTYQAIFAAAEKDLGEDLTLDQ